jgi:threonine/homoserine/homoserine lactone efflux protein
VGVIESAGLAGVLVALAALPSSSVALVVARSATFGVANGVAVAAGVVLGDLVFVALAILGLSAAAEALGGFFVVLKVLAGCYLLWLGVSMLRAGAPEPEPRIQSQAAGTGHVATSFVAGFVLTLGDVKAILFYASLFPLFVDLSAISAADIVLVCVLTVLSIGGVKTAYAVFAAKAAAFARRRRFGRAPQRIAGGLMLGAGSYMILKA